MELIREQIQQLFTYLPSLTRREDFFSFWEETKSEVQEIPLNPQIERADAPFPTCPVYKISYCGFDATRIHGLLILPREEKDKKYPCMISYHGFSGDRGKPWEFMHWVAMGLAVLSIDIREQGGLTGTNTTFYSNGMVQNVSTKGILDPYEYYYRAVYMDCIRAIDFAQKCKKIDKDRIFVRGSSQGGGLVMAVCALDKRPKFGIANTPSNSNLEARVLGKHGIYAGVNEFLRRYPDKLEIAFQTLSYFDTMNLADQITCPIFASVGLADPICPAKMYFATYNRITAPKQITIYPFNEHDGAAHVHIGKELYYIKDSGILEPDKKSELI